MLLYNMESVAVSKTFASTIQNTWNCALHKIYNVSGMALNAVLMFTGCLAYLLRMNCLSVGLNFYGSVSL